ncbi:MAG: M81 family metallopeptidase [Beijerinckiaceae bacterium]
MAWRVAVGGFLHESHSFAPMAAAMDDFVRPGGFPPLSQGEAMLMALQGSSVAAAGMIEALQKSGHAIVPLLWGFASPSAPVTRQAFENIAGRFIDLLARAHREQPLDAVLIDLHGAMMSDDFPDAEAELLRRVRIIVGETVPVLCSLDPHVNLTADMVERCDGFAAYRTYPHVDMKETGMRVADLLARRMVLGRPFAKAFRAIDFLTPITSQCTLVEPMAGLMGERDTLARGNAVAELMLGFGFPYADFSGCGPALVCYADDQQSADHAADALQRAYSARKAHFSGGVVSAREGVARAIAAPRGPVVLADTQDNPGGGGHGDTTGLLAELIAQKANDVVFGLINDAESAAACHTAGVGAALNLRLGGKSLAPPLPVKARVLRLSDGVYINEGPMTRGNQSDLGPTALIEAAPGICVVVVSRKTQAYDQMLFKHLGIDPAQKKIIALKSSVHFRADFQPIASEVIVVAAPGPVIADPRALPFQHLREGMLG